MQEKQQKIESKLELIIDEKKALELNKQEIKDTRKRFQDEMRRIKIEFNRMLLVGNEKNIEGPINDKIVQLEKQGKQIINGVEKCLFNEVEITTIKDATTGKLLYAFPIEELLKDPYYVVVDKYYNGMARVKRNNKYGYYDIMGNLMIDFKYDFAENFIDSVVIVNRNNDWFLINKSDSVIYKFGSNVQFVSKLKENIYRRTLKDNQGNWETYLIKYKNEDVNFVKISDKYFAIYPIDKNELMMIFNQFIKKKSDDSFDFELSNNDYYYKNRENNNFDFLVNYKAGLIDINGNLILDCIYDEIELIEVGYYKCKIGDEITLFHKNGTPVSSHNFSVVRDFNKYGLAIVGPTDKNKYGIINLKGEYVTPPIFNQIDTFQINVQLAKVREYSYGMINRFGELVVGCQYSEIGLYNQMKLSIVANGYSYGKRYGIIDENGLEIVPPIFDVVTETNEGFLIENHNKNRRGINKVLKSKVKKSFRLNKKGICISKNKNEFVKMIRNYYSDN